MNYWEQVLINGVRYRYNRVSHVAQVHVASNGQTASHWRSLSRAKASMIASEIDDRRAVQSVPTVYSS